MMFSVIVPVGMLYIAIKMSNFNFSNGFGVSCMDCYNNSYSKVLYVQWNLSIVTTLWATKYSSPYGGQNLWHKHHPDTTKWSTYVGVV